MFRAADDAASGLGYSKALRRDHTMTATPGPTPALADGASLARGIRAGERATLARAITLIESRRADHRKRRRSDPVQDLLPLTGKAVRIGITGVPGVGKSTTIDTLGSDLTAQGHKVAVLAVDPSSTAPAAHPWRQDAHGAARRRPERLHPALAVVRNARRCRRTTRETMLLCEAAGYDVVMVETVGMGQSETAVADMTDFFLVLDAARRRRRIAGYQEGRPRTRRHDRRQQGRRRQLARARRAAGEYRAALHILTPRSPTWTPPVITYSALTGDGMADLWATVIEHRRSMAHSGELEARRSQQQVKWMWAILDDRIHGRLIGDPALRARLPTIEADVATGRLSPALAADNVLRMLGLKVD